LANVVIDVERLRNVHCGLGQFALHLGRALLDELDGQLTPVLLVRPGNRELLADRTGRFLDASPWRAEPLAPFVRPWCGLLPFRGRPALWHATHQDTRFLPLHRSTRLILTIHDLNFLREKSPASIRRRLKRLQAKVNRASVLTTASQHAAGEIREHLDIRGKDIAVIPHGVCVNPSDAAATRPNFLEPGRFLFTIGDITPKKNFHTLVDVASRLPEFKIVIAGSKSTDYAHRIEQKAAANKLADRIILPGKVSDAERSWLYQNCTAFLFPSRSEGFGLPLIEAMGSGRPVFCSHATSLPEVGGDLAFYWHDLDPDTMASAVRAGLQIVERDSQFGDRLRQHAGRFSWPRAARAYLALYQRVLDKSHASDLGAAGQSDAGTRRCRSAA
jgi:glycosyltransferase involved in cell wall biosynthesis